MTALSRTGAFGWAASLALPVAAVFLVSAAHILPAHAGNTDVRFLVAQQPISAPAGFHGICSRYNWVCAQSAQAGHGNDATIVLAKTINLQINRQVREIDDQAQYGKTEHWALPTDRGGDCEDLVLLKKKMLIARGVPSQSLLIATVLDRKLNSHAVLILRTRAGDLVLDNLTNRIVNWKKTGYTFLKLQNPNALRKWDAVIAGGVVADTPTASR